MRVEWNAAALLGWLSLSAFGCAEAGSPGGDGDEGGGSGADGQLSVALGAAGHGITGLRIDIVPAEADCSGSAVATQTLLVDAEPAVGGDERVPSEPARQSFTLPAGEFRVCVTPLSGDSPADRCDPGEALASVRAGETTEATLTLQCRDEPDGVIQTIVQLNEAPNIEALVIDPGTSISVCDAVTLSLEADDADGDALTTEWGAGDPLRLRPYEGTLQVDGTEATFSATIAGNYIVNVAVDDGNGGRDELRVDIEVTAADCE
jgi:hypothetical protein